MLVSVVKIIFYVATRNNIHIIYRIGKEITVKSRETSPFSDILIYFCLCLRAMKILCASAKWKKNHRTFLSQADLKILILGALGWLS